MSGHGGSSYAKQNSALYTCGSIASHCSNQLFKKNFYVSKSYSLRRVYCLSGHGDHCFAKQSALHYSGSIAFRCAIHLSTKVFLFIVLCSYFNILSSRQDLLICFDNWRYRSTVFPARAAIFPSSYSLNAYLILNVKTFYFWVVLCWRLKINAFPIFALIVTQTGYLFVPSSYISRHSLFNPK